MKIDKIDEVLDEMKCISQPLYLSSANKVSGTSVLEDDYGSSISEMDGV